MLTKTGSRWRRVGLSAFSVAVVVLVVSVAFAINGPPQKHWWDGIVGWLFVISFFAFAGWIVALPIILFRPSISGNRIYLLAVIGTMIGPTVIGAINLIAWLIDRKSGTDFGWGFVLIATAISAMTTGLYLTVIKMYSREQLQQDTP